MSEKQRWMESLPDVGTWQAGVHAKAALGRLYTALTFVDAESRLEKAQYAAAHIVRWRRGLGVDSRRVEYEGSRTGDDLLWCAVRLVAAAQLSFDDVGTADHLRCAESYLRAHWKENQ